MSDINCSAFSFAKPSDLNLSFLFVFLCATFVVYQFPMGIRCRKDLKQKHFFVLTMSALTFDREGIYHFQNHREILQSLLNYNGKPPNVISELVDIISFLCHSKSYLVRKNTSPSTLFQRTSFLPQNESKTIC